MDDPSRAPNVVPPPPPVWPRIARIVLLAITLVLLFPEMLGGITHGAWPALVLKLGQWKWAIWGVCFVAIVLLGFRSRARS